MNGKELPHGCGLVIEVFCVYLALSVSFRFVSPPPFRRFAVSLLLRIRVRVETSYCP